VFLDTLCRTEYVKTRQPPVQATVSHVVAKTVLNATAPSFSLPIQIHLLHPVSQLALMGFIQMFVRAMPVTPAVLPALTLLTIALYARMDFISLARAVS
jgi:hypothetical protein